MEQFNKIKYNKRSHQFTIEKQAYAYFKKQSPYLIVHTWNMLNIAHKNLLEIKDDELKSNKSRLNAFKVSVKAYYTKLYQDKVKCRNSYCTDCSKEQSPHLSDFQL